MIKLIFILFLFYFICKIKRRAVAEWRELKNEIKRDKKILGHLNRSKKNKFMFKKLKNNGL